MVWRFFKQPLEVPPRLSSTGFTGTFSPEIPRSHVFVSVIERVVSLLLWAELAG
jgi:hypothetical protein